MENQHTLNTNGSKTHPPLPDSTLAGEWDEERMDIIGVNGNDGLHYSDTDVGSATLINDSDDD